MNQDLVGNLTDWLMWQEETEELLQEAEEQETMHIRAKHKDMLFDYETNDTLIKRMLSEFILLCDANPEEDRTEECSDELLEAHATAMADLERIITEFHAKWGGQYEEYEKEVDAVKKKYKKLRALARNPAAFQIVMASQPRSRRSKR